MEKKQKSAVQNPKNGVYLTYQIKNINQLYYKFEQQENSPIHNNYIQKTNGNFFNTIKVGPEAKLEFSQLQIPLKQTHPKYSPLPISSNQNNHFNLHLKYPNTKFQNHSLNFEKTSKRTNISDQIQQKNKFNFEKSQISCYLKQDYIKNSNQIDSIPEQRFNILQRENAQICVDPHHDQISILQRKKNKKGLAFISLIVKNVVLKHKRLTYGQVSDLVLGFCKEELQNLTQKQQEKETKNIKRRVYDALNVLVSVNILAKDNRQVVVTQWTNFQGKKLNSEWNTIKAQEDQINVRLKACEKKQAFLQQVINKYKSVLALRVRNQQRIKVNFMNNFNSVDDLSNKILFPFLTIPRNISDLEMEINKGDKSETLAIRGRNIRLVSDVDVAVKLNLEDTPVDMSIFLSEVEKIKKEVSIKQKSQTNQH